MADHRHKRDTNARRFRVPKAPFVAGPLALVATLSTVGVGVLAANPETRDLLATSGATSSGSSASQSLAATVDLSERAPVVSRSGSRIEQLSDIEMMLTDEATARAIEGADTKLWTTTDLNLWTTPQEATAEKMGEVDGSTKVLVTGREAAGRQEIVVDGVARWVTAGYLSKDKPGAIPGIGGSCTNGTTVPAGVSPNIVKVHQAVCAAFPSITTYGTLRADGEHAQGIAVDIMVSGEMGQQVADFVRANYAALGVNYLIHARNIWSVDRASEGWRWMEDRGSITQNHYDHVHVTTY